LRIQFDVELSKPLKCFLQTGQGVFKASSVHQDIICPDENTDVEHVFKDFHHTCLESMSAVSFLCQNPLKASRLENQAAFSRCWKFTSRIGRNPATVWDLEFAYLQSTVILILSRFPGLGAIRTGKDYRLLGFLRMNPFFSSIFTCLIIQSLCFGAYLRALARPGTTSDSR